MSEPDLTISIVNWNTASLLRECLNSLFRHPPGWAFETVVVDNGSRDGSPAMVRREFPSVRLLSSRRNLGYAGAHNWTILATRSPYLLLLNSDILVHRDSVDLLMEFSRRTPEAGIVGPRLVYPNGERQRSCTRDLTLWSWFCQQTGLDRLFPNNPLLAAYWRVALDAEQAVAVPQLSGAAWLLKREVVTDIGLFDEGYRMYCEDTDYALRARRAGWRLYYLPQASMTHWHGGSARQVPAEMIATHGRACARYFLRHEGAAAASAARALALAGAGGRWLLWALSATLLGDRHALSQAHLFARAWRLLRQTQSPSLPS